MTEAHNTINQAVADGDLDLAKAYAVQDVELTYAIEGRMGQILSQVTPSTCDKSNA